MPMNTFKKEMAQVEGGQTNLAPSCVGGILDLAKCQPRNPLMLPGLLFTLVSFFNAERKLFKGLSLTSSVDVLFARPLAGL